MMTTLTRWWNTPTHMFYTVGLLFCGLGLGYQLGRGMELMEKQRPPGVVATPLPVMGHPAPASGSVAVALGACANLEPVLVSSAPYASSNARDDTLVPLCAPVVFLTGDVVGFQVLYQGRSWLFEFRSPGLNTSARGSGIAVGKGTNAISRPVDVWVPAP